MQQYFSPETRAGVFTGDFLNFLIFFLSLTPGPSTYFS